MKDKFNIMCNSFLFFWPLTCVKEKSNFILKKDKYIFKYMFKNKSVEFLE